MADDFQRITDLLLNATSEAAKKDDQTAALHNALIHLIQVLDRIDRSQKEILTRLRRH
jgi:hypothetical protein